MQISLNWMNEYVDLTGITPEQIAHELTMSGLEVEHVEKTGAKFSNIKTAKIKALNPHPDADKLRLVTVDTGIGEKTVVCGAQNIEVGQVIPYASIGSKVFSRKTDELFELTPVKIRGIESEGMLCSADELGLEDMGYQEDDGILILSRFLNDIKLNEPLEDILNITNDNILHVAPTANRGDQMSMIGIARELSALFNRKLNFSMLECTNSLKTPAFKVEIIDEDVCKYYACAIVKNVKTKPSPAWLAKRLVASGIRSINNVVDITNYVLLEYGQPLHAFDYDKLSGYLCVRYAKQGEKIVTLDGVERELTNESVLIADQNKGVCIGGVFGGANSEVDESTKNLVLESAYFTPASNRRSARSVGYRSEACARFERGVDIEATKPALFRAMQLLTELANAQIEGIVEDGNNKLEEIIVTLRFNQVERCLGTKIANDRCCEILDKLGFEVLGKNEMAAKVKIPSFRANDATREIDLIEEIARINGYDKIEPTLPATNQAAKISEETRVLKKVNEILLGYGFSEIITNSLIGKGLLEEFSLSHDDTMAVKVENAQSEEYTMLRQTLIGNVLKVIQNNFSNNVKNTWVYEIGKSYLKTTEADEKSPGVEEKKILSGAISGDINLAKWNKPREYDFYTLKGVLESLLIELSLDNRVRFEPCKDVSYLHPGKSARIILLGKSPQTLCVFGELHPTIKKSQKFTQDVYLFEMDLDLIIEETKTSLIRFKKLPQYPEMQRDIAFIAPQNLSYAQLSLAIKKSANSKIFKSCELFDIYQGENIEPGCRSTAFRLRFQDESTTLTDEVVDGLMNDVRIGLQKLFETVKFRA